MLENENLLKQILDDSNEMIQVSDIDSFTMLYANETARKFTVHENLPYRGMHCYEYLMGLKEKCPFCPMHELGAKTCFEKEVNNGKDIYKVKTKRIDWEGQDAFIEYATCITEIKHSEEIYNSQIKTLLDSIPNAQGIFHLDLTDDSVISVNGISKEVLKMNHLSHVNEAISAICSYIPDKKSQESFYALFNKENLIKEHQLGKTELVQEVDSYFEDHLIRPVRMAVRLITNPQTNHLECIIFGLDISNEKAEHKKYEEELREQLAIFNALSSAYTNVYLVEPNLSKLKVLKLNGYVTSGIDKSTGLIYDYKDIREQYVKDRVYPEDQEKMNEAISLDVVKEKLSANPEYTGNYRVLTNGVIHYCEFKYIKLENVNYIIAGFQITDDIVENKRKQQEKDAEHRKEILEQIAIFNNLSSRFRNVYLANLDTGLARILKIAEDYNYKEIGNLKEKVFPYDKVVELWISQRVHPDDREKVKEALDVEHLKKLFTTQKECTGNYRAIEDGKIVNYQFYVSPIDDAHNVIIGFQVIDDIIQAHLAEEKKQREKEEKYQRELEKSYRKLEDMHSIVTASSMGTWTITLVDGKAPTLVPDDLMKELLGIQDLDLNPEEIYQYWFSRIKKEAVQSVLNSVEKMKQGNSDENTYLWNHPTLGERYVRCGGTAYKVDGGYVLRGYHYDVDKIVREQKEQEEKLANTLRMEKQHSEIISAISTIYTTIFRAELDTHLYEIVNSVSLMGSVARQKGNFDDVKEDVLHAFMAEDCQEEMREFLDFETLSKRLKDSNTIVTEYRDPNNRWFQARFIVKSRDAKGNVKEVLYVARDFTKEKEQELKQESALRDALISAKHANRAKTSFLSNMSHDIRTPMNAIIGFTALAQSHIENKELVQDYLSKIHTSSTHLLNLINEILDMSRIESGTVKLDENVVHLPDVLSELRTMIQGQVLAKQQNLYIDTLDVVNEDIVTDKLRLNQVLLNIVSNAIKYTGNGGNINIRVIEKPSQMKNYATYVFSVKDTGMGMSDEFVKHIFEMFTRENSSTVSGIQGTGLGMSITKTIVDMMNGTIDVKSELGKGSEFIVTIDFKLANKSHAYEINPDLKDARALVVDDDVTTCQSVSKMLRGIEMRADWSTSGKEAVIRAKEATDLKDEYKAFIIDYLMPDMNGIETVRRIRKVISEDVPIIVLTAYDYTDIEEEAKEAGVTAFISKPIFMSELKKVLSKEGVVEQEEVVPTFNHQGKKVLLVEDNDLNREIAHTLLEEAGMIVTEATDGSEAVDIMNKANEDDFDLILMDIQMPKMDGYTATREIRTLENNHKANIPIIAMTANAFEEDRQKSFEAGMNAHIAKPIDLNIIAKTLDEIFK